jgi:class 3 adenylate cyclase/tetratricopeptide (TPR) repeat protein
MICGGCGTENEAGGRFCEACGTPLAARCPSCGEGVKTDARFCRSCGFALGADAPPLVTSNVPAAPAADAPVAERRLVTVVFADLVGFTTLAEDRDPESTRELLTRYFDTARDAIERHGGTVEKFIGDAVMAVWGTPVAHEDDGERAVRAALELVRDVPGIAPQLAARAGVLTGEAAVTLGATNQGMVAGDLVNTAARLQGVAEPGTVLVGEPTMRGAERAIVFEEVGEHSLKGKLTPVPAWRAVRVVAQRGGTQRTDALEPPFVGRDEELRLLKDQLHAPGRDQRARLVSITGPGGIGKSRLVWELEKYMDGITELVYWHRGRSPSYGEGISFWALGEMVRRRAGLTEDDDEATSRDRIHASVEEYISDPSERELVEPALLTLLGIGEAVGGGRDALFPAWRTFFERISERGTTALIFEDLQWADSGLLDFIDHLLDWSKSRPILVVTLARPELFDKRPDWGAGRRAFTSLALDPLTDDAVRQLLEGVVPGLPESAVSTIVSRAEGMPLYAVETVRALLAEGKIERDGDVFRPVGDLSSLTVPDSLRSLIASRLDALDATDRALLQHASVLGQVFDLPTLATVTGEDPTALGERLRELARREIVEVETDPRSPERGQYKFVQALIREVAYGTLALRDRRSRHLAVARHYEALGDEALAGALASHYLAAHESSAEGAEADAVAAQARIALRAAAERAASLGAQGQALHHLERAMTITREPAERADLLEAAARAAHFAAAGTAVRYATEALEARRALGDGAGIDRVAAALAQVLLDEDNLDEAVALLEPVLADECERDPESEAELQNALSRTYMRLGRNAEALEHAERALDIAEPHGYQRIVADALNARSAVIGRRGRRREAYALQRAAVELAAANGWADLELRLRHNLIVLMQQDDFAGGVEESRRIVEIAERIGNVPWYLRGVAGLADSLLEIGEDWDEAARAIEDALARAGDDPPLPLIAADIQMRAHRGDSVSDLLPALDRLSTNPHLGSSVEQLRSITCLAAGDFARAGHHARRSLELDETGEILPSVADVLIKIASATSDLPQLHELAGLMDESSHTGLLWRATRDMVAGGIAALEGRTAEARTLMQQAIDVQRSMRLALTVAQYELAAARLAPGAPEAPAWLADARDMFARIGARPFLEQAKAAEAALGPSATAARSPAASEAASTLTEPA